MGWGSFRYKYTSKRDEFEQYFNTGTGFDCPELFTLHYDAEAFEAIHDNIPGEKFAPGFNPDMGDNVWFKTRESYPVHHSMYTADYIARQSQNVLKRRGDMQ